MWKSRRVPDSAAQAITGALLAGAIVLLCGTYTGGGAPGLAQSSDVAHPLEWDGDHWSELSPEQKDAYLNGFLAGAAASQVYGPLLDGAELDGNALVEGVERLRRERALNFTFAPALYHARLHDYYFYANHREQPIYQALAEIDFRIRAAR